MMRALMPSFAEKCASACPKPTHTLDEFARLRKPGGVAVLSAPFASNVHMAPYHTAVGSQNIGMNIICRNAARASNR